MSWRLTSLAAVVFAFSFESSAVAATERPRLKEGDFVMRDFAFSSGEKLPEVRIHYRTLGQPQRDANGRVTNAVLLMHGTTGTGTQFMRREFAGELYGPGQPLDISKYFIVLRDGLGHGESSKPSDGLKAKFPRYGYRDMVTADYRLLTEGLKVNHLRLVMGTSSGGMMVWLWGIMYPDFMDGLVPLGALPIQISGRNRVWRRMVSDSIRNDPAWKGGNYTAQPPSLRLAAQMVFFMMGNPVMRQEQAPTMAAADAALDEFAAGYMKYSDANDMLFAIESSNDYDPAPHLEKIKAKLLAINSLDDLINPPELGILDREIKRVRHGRIYMIPYTEESRGHGSHTYAALWQHELAKFLAELEN